jgi:hypothetical protein
VYQANALMPKKRKLYYVSEIETEGLTTLMHTRVIQVEAEEGAEAEADYRLDEIAAFIEIKSLAQP